MDYTVKWIINGEITVEAESQENAENKIKNKLKNLIENNNKSFDELGATAIQGSANLKSRNET